ncbi:hypothetical protein MRX96_029958 [Rhipicephalus microplus]
MSHSSPWRTSGIRLHCVHTLHDRNHFRRSAVRNAWAPTCNSIVCNDTPSPRSAGKERGIQARRDEWRRPPFLRPSRRPFTVPKFENACFAFHRRPRGPLSLLARASSHLADRGRRPCREEKQKEIKDRRWLRFRFRYRGSAGIAEKKKAASLEYGDTG